MQEFHKKGGDINAEDVYATPQPDLPNLAPAETAPSTARERYLFWPKISASGLPPYPLTPFSLGATPTLATPPLSSFLFSSPCMPAPPAARVPLVHAAAAWHRWGSTPLMGAALNGATAAVASLVERRADLDAQANNG